MFKHQKHFKDQVNQMGYLIVNQHFWYFMDI